MSLTFFSAYEPGKFQKLPKTKKTRNFNFFFYGKIETEIESGLLQQTINTLNKLLITFIRSFEQKNFYFQKVMPLLILAIFPILAIIPVRKKLEGSGFHHSS